MFSDILLRFIVSLTVYDTLGPAYNEFSYNEHPLTTSSFLCIRLIDSNVNKFGYSEHPPKTSSFYRPHPKDEREVIVSLCVSVHTRGKGGTPARSMSGGGVPPSSLQWGIPQSNLGWGTWGYPHPWTVAGYPNPALDRGVPPSSL